MYQLPHFLDISHGACNNANVVVERLRLGKKAAIFCSEKNMKRAGNRIVESLSGYDYKIFQPASTEEAELRRIAPSLSDYDFILGIGGGKNIDTAKYVAYLNGKPWIAVPTIPSHDGVVSSRASLSDNQKKISVTAVEPSAVIADLDVIQNAPYRYTAAGAGDAISKISAIEDWRIAEEDGKERMHTIIANISLVAAEGVMKHAYEIKERKDRGLEVLIWALTYAGSAMNLAGSSRPGSGSEHNFSHALDELGSDALHGEQVALGTIIMQYLQGGNWKRIKNAMGELGLPTKLSDIGVDYEMAVNALVRARNMRDRYTILNKIDIDERRAGEILDEVGVI